MPNVFVPVKPLGIPPDSLSFKIYRGNSISHSQPESQIRMNDCPGQQHPVSLSVAPKASELHLPVRLEGCGRWECDQRRSVRGDLMDKLWTESSLKGKFILDVCTEKLNKVFLTFHVLKTVYEL